jgi:hypothetical protein
LLAPVVHLLLLSLPLFVAGVWLWRGHARQVGVAAWLLRGATGSAVSIAVLLLPFVVFACSCGAGNNPVRQVLVPAFASLLCVSGLDSVKERSLAAVSMLGAGLVLAWHFHRLVLPTDLTACRFTGDPAFVSNSCEREADVRSEWYTPLTGLYPLRVREPVPGRASQAASGAP